MAQRPSRRRRDKTGPEPWRDLARIGKLELGAGPGRLAGPTHLIHVAGLTTWWKATTAGVAACTRNAVDLALELPVPSLAMPLIGAGPGGLTEEASPQAIPEGLAKLDQVPPETADLQVTIVTFRK